MIRKTKQTKKHRQKRRGTSAGREIIQALTELRDVLQAGESLESHFTVRTVIVPNAPLKYSATSVRQTRTKLGVSQAIFAKLLGVSTVLVQHWESGSRVPAAWACRLLDEMNRDPAHWRSMLQPRRSGSAA